MKCNLHIGNVQTLIVQLNTDICTDHMYTPPNQDREYSHHSLCLSLVQTRERHYSDLCISPEITDSVLEVFNNGSIPFHVYIYVLFGGSKITADGDCNHEIKRHLFLGRKAMTNLSY